jgi:hypothetical protein
MKKYKTTKLFFTLFFTLGFLLLFISCESNEEDLKTRVRVRDFTKAELINLHEESDKSWKLTEIILPERFIDHPASINNACVADDTYTFSHTNWELYESMEDIKIELGDTRCFETYSEAESFDGKLLYKPYNLNGVDVFRVEFFLNECSIANNVPVGTTTRCDESRYRLVELTADRMVFSNATFIGDQTFGYVFEKIYGCPIKIYHFLVIIDDIYFQKPKHFFFYLRLIKCFFF